MANAEAHGDRLGAIERDVLEEQETVLDDHGDIIRKSKFYGTEARFSFLAFFLTGKDFDRGGELWKRFVDSRRIRDAWTHPKPPFDTWSLTLQQVRSAIDCVHDMFVKLSEMMGIAPPLWLCPIDDVLKSADDAETESRRLRMDSDAAPP